jgi:biotin synthase-related radical SAM superfamily protein
MYRRYALKLSPDDYILNPGFLKLELMLRGVRVDEALYEEDLLATGSLSFKGTANGLDLLLPEDTWVNVPYLESFAKDSPYRLLKKKGKYFVANSKNELEVAFIHQPEFYKKKTSTGVPFSRIGTVHGNYIAVTPSIKCDFFKFHVECKYCSEDLKSENNNVALFSVDEVIETVEAAYKEGKAGIVYLTTGSVTSPDGGVEIFKPYIKEIKKHFHTLVAVESLPPKENRWIDETYAMGVDSVIYNLEIFDPERFEEICPGRAKHIGRERYLEALKYAASIFPNGTVACHLIVGLESPESTVQGIDYFADMGVVPILPVFRPVIGTPLESCNIPSIEEIAPIYGYLYMKIKEKKINMNWVKDISIITTPLEGRFFVGEDATLNSILHNFYKSKLGSKAAWGLATLRRMLRVKKTDTV